MRGKDLAQQDEVVLPSRALGGEGGSRNSQLEGEESCQNKNPEVLSSSQLLSRCSQLNSPPVIPWLTKSL
ncbi:hypothetical protein AV530_019414 [Patagioenas fasciata monilis]|uniref:Uncharacterized protein n=1 Tax=Patagioenas fasciata monilis TaxID=372326 RepID=A0A1V4JDQ7_PATFA|nr:hypothetical protein AV530_019414 [Patagioenas fasciata monilis]